MGPIRDYTRGRELAAAFARLVPAGSHTYSKGDDQFPCRSPPIVARAKGAYCWDADGNRFIDWAMGNRRHPRTRLSGRQRGGQGAIDRGVNFTRPSVLEHELAEYLVDLLPVAEMVKFGKNGSDVTTAAVKLARAYTGRKYVAYCVDHPFFSIHDWFIGTTPVERGASRRRRRA